MSKIMDLINDIGADKWAHAVGGAVIAQATLPLFHWLQASWLAIVPVIVAGVAKEWHDRSHPSEHTADIRDAAWTILGGLAGLLFGLWCRL